MPTLAIGDRDLARDAGVTLVEALVALMIVGLMAGAVVLLAPGPDLRTRSEAESLAARLTLAGDQSVIANRNFALVISHEGYGFERLENVGWISERAGSPLGFRAWREGVEVQVEHSAVAPDDRRIVRFDTLGGVTPASVVLNGQGARWRVIVGGQGDVHVERAP